MLAARFGYQRERRSSASVDPACDVSQRDHPNETLVAIQDRQAADLKISHLFTGVLHVLVLEAIFHVRGHRLGDECIGPASLSDRSDCYIPIGNHPDEPVVGADRQKSDIMRRHQLRGGSCGFTILASVVITSRTNILILHEWADRRGYLSIEPVRRIFFCSSRIP